MKLMGRSLVYAAAVATTLSGAVALADSHGGGDSTDMRLRAAIAGEHRAEEKKARDAFRNPYETLNFFGLKEDMTVLEINASGSWYTEIIAPVLANTGKYYATLTHPSVSDRAKASFDRHVEALNANKNIYGDAEIVGIGSGNMEPIEPGSADLVLTFRNIHNWMANDSIDDMLKMMYDAAKPGGHLGIVEHRGNPMVKQDPKARSGYVNEGYTIKIAEDAGWQLVATSDINNNPMDDKDYDGRVWRLPPTLRYFGREGFPALEGTDRHKSLAIGESDRYTLLFVKPVS